MKRRFFIGAAAAVLVLTLAGCLSIGRGHGPVDSFVISAALNPGLHQDLVAQLNLGPEPKEVFLVVPPGTNLRSLVAKLSLNVEATITVVSSGARVVQQNGVTANDFSAPVMYSIEVSGDKEPWRYRVMAREMDVNTRLALVAVAGGSGLAPAFNPAVPAYSVVVPFASTSVRIEARAQSRFARSVSIEGAESPGPVGRADVDFSGVAQKTVTIQTLAEDGVTRGQYTITLVRGAPDSNSLLAMLDLQGAPLVPVFSPAQIGYQVVVPFETQGVLLRARPQSPFATLALSVAATVSGGQTTFQQLAFQGDPAGAGGAMVDFSRSNALPLVISVTAQDGSVRQYVAEILRASPDGNNLLADLSIGGDQPLAPAFAPDRLSYVAIIPFDTPQVRIHAHPQSRVASLQVAGAMRGVIVRGSPVTPDGAVMDLPLNVARLPVQIIVTAQNGSALRYVVDLRRAPAPQPVQVIPAQPAPAQAVPVQPAPVAPAQTAPTTVAPAQVVPPQPAPAAPMAPAQPAPAAARPTLAQPAPSPVIAPAVHGSDRVNVSASLVLGAREAAALAASRDTVGNSAVVTVRPYRSTQILVQSNVPVTARPQANTQALSFQYQSPGVALGRDRLIEIEITIPTSTGKFLYYKEAMQAGEQTSLNVPFFLYMASVPIAWPAVGSPVQASGYVSSSPGGKDRGERPQDKESFARNAKGEYGVELELADAKSGQSYGRVTAWRPPGLARGQSVELSAPVVVPEGSTVVYSLRARAAGNRTWSVAGQAQVWTTRLRYEGGFEPVRLSISDEMTLEKEDKPGKDEKPGKPQSKEDKH